MNDQDSADLLINPFCAIRVSHSLTVKHEPLTTKEQWVRVNARLIRNLGTEEWLTRLLAVLESGQPNR
jgi:hypothetical protein